jgi:hypothetical protein
VTLVGHYDGSGRTRASLARLRLRASVR